LTRRSTFYAGALPDRITIFRRAICAVCASEAEVVEQVRRTVIHEVGHHFGIGDARLRELGWCESSGRIRYAAFRARPCP
jgi:predicted Zn-dependent protease with MMP-like domain